MSKQKDRVGYVLADKYEIVRRIGRGGFSTVWLAADKNLEGKLWAVKEFRHNDRDEGGNVFKQSLIAEANMMKRLDHPTIVRVVDIIDTGETIFVVMDFVEGRTLSRVLHDEGHALKQEDVISYGIQLCDALGYLHGQNPPIVYRDMKPGNVMLREEGVVKLIDFGIAREYDASKSRDTKVIATEGYAAPEQLNPEVQTDPRADIYSLGVTLYHLVTGHDPTKPPFEIRPIRDWDPTLSEGLEAIILRATQPDPNKRYQTIGEMRYDLEHYKELTSEYRAVLQHKVAVFRRWVVASITSLAVGVGCFAGSAALKSSTYESYLHAAQSASTLERMDSEGRAIASEAEENYLNAIGIEPSRIENYQALVELYKDDLLFTQSESERWGSLWAANGSGLQDSPSFARLNYDVGILYLCYYDYGATGDASAGRTTLGAAVANARLATPWFERAVSSLDSDVRMAEEFDEGQPESLRSLLVVSKFTSEIGRAAAEGSERQVYEELWPSLVSVLDDVEATDAEPMVRLRLYQIVFETIRSQQYLRGLRRAGVTEDEAVKLLDRVEMATELLSDEAQDNEQALLPVYEEIVSGYDAARQNISTTYHNVVVERGGDDGPLGDVPGEDDESNPALTNEADEEV